MTADQLRCEIEHYWPRHRIGEGTFIVMAKKMSRYDEIEVGRAFAKFVADNPDAKTPVWKLILSIVAGESPEKRENYWVDRVKFERSIKGRSWRDGLSDEAMIVIGIKESAKYHGPAWLMTECRLLQSGCRAADIPVPDYIADVVSGHVDIAEREPDRNPFGDPPTAAPLPTEDEAMYEPVMDDSIPF